MWLCLYPRKRFEGLLIIKQLNDKNKLILRNKLADALDNATERFCNEEDIKLNVGELAHALIDITLGLNKQHPMGIEVYVKKKKITDFEDKINKKEIDYIG